MNWNFRPKRKRYRNGSISKPTKLLRQKRIYGRDIMKRRVFWINPSIRSTFKNMKPVTAKK